jgi:hypothetical protein
VCKAKANNGHSRVERRVIMIKAGAQSTMRNDFRQKIVQRPIVGKLLKFVVPPVRKKS